jgi:hypothetical protein
MFSLRNMMATGGAYYYPSAFIRENVNAVVQVTEAG